jgi:hypothetical protein
VRKKKETLESSSFFLFERWRYTLKENIFLELKKASCVDESQLFIYYIMKIKKKQGKKITDLDFYCIT